MPQQCPPFKSTSILQRLFGGRIGHTWAYVGRTCKPAGRACEWEYCGSRSAWPPQLVFLTTTSLAGDSGCCIYHEWKEEHQHRHRKSSRTVVVMSAPRKIQQSPGIRLFRCLKSSSLTEYLKWWVIAGDRRQSIQLLPNRLLVNLLSSEFFPLLTMNTLPPELLLKIVHFTPDNSILQLRSVDRTFCALATSRAPVFRRLLAENTGRSLTALCGLLESELVRGCVKSLLLDLATEAHSGEPATIACREQVVTALSFGLPALNHISILFSPLPEDVDHHTPVTDPNWLSFSIQYNGLRALSMWPTTLALDTLGLINIIPVLHPAYTSATFVNFFRGVGVSRVDGSAFGVGLADLRCPLLQRLTFNHILFCPATAAEPFILAHAATLEFLLMIDCRILVDGVLQRTWAQVCDSITENCTSLRQPAAGIGGPGFENV
ncbi:hypothetical protein BV25DRAFT_1593096 [Artomyces pyxidatus]|uniref:Uncharacterized protein n=1 Tax=Artomyces pyxidatus TaxID=48021 RepID=A0ACB8TBS4_9AGAM|nr:hypothetical protein BV25DRAFT_1593096 [Artomyces pyxidatus]